MSAVVETKDLPKSYRETLAVNALETGNLPISGATGGVLKRSLAALKKLIDSTLEEVRIKA